VRRGGKKGVKLHPRPVKQITGASKTKGLMHQGLITGASKTVPKTVQVGGPEAKVLTDNTLGVNLAQYIQGQNTWSSKTRLPKHKMGWGGPEQKMLRDGNLAQSIPG
jgi:hypothetical protein